MVVPHAILPDLNTLDADSLRALLVETHERYCTTAQRLQSRESEIEHLKLLLAKLQRMHSDASRRSCSDRSNSWNCDWRIWSKHKRRRASQRRKAAPAQTADVTPAQKKAARRAAPPAPRTPPRKRNPPALGLLRSSPLSLSLSNSPDTRPPPGRC